MQEENEKHIAICEKCRGEEFKMYISWLCVPCDTVGYGYGCPNHPHLVDNSVQV